MCLHSWITYSDEIVITDPMGLICVVSFNTYLPEALERRYQVVSGVCRANRGLALGRPEQRGPLGEMSEHYGIKNQEERQRKCCGGIIQRKETAVMFSQHNSTDVGRLYYKQY